MIDHPPTPPPGLLRIRSIVVEELFGLYTHHVDLRLDDRVTIIHGPNGVGKTVLLEMIDALLSGALSRLARVGFKSMMISFTDGSELIARKTMPDRPADSELHIQLRQPGLPVQEGNVPIQRMYRSELLEYAEELPWISVLGDDTFVDRRTGERLSPEKVYSRYRDQLPRAVVRRERAAHPDFVAAFANKVGCHVIEAQRLLRMDYKTGVRSSRVEGTMVYTVREYANDLARRISEALGRYARESQSLDQSFPRRLLAPGGISYTLPQIRSSMSTLDAERLELKNVGLLEEASVYPFDTSALNDYDQTQARVMTLYIQDTQTKLGVLSNLSQRIAILLRNVNKKLRNKRVQVDREKGLLVLGHDDRPMELEQLSSGEQHEIVLHYDLLFKVRPNTLVLIDEPELSLHVAWQKAFLPDLQEIIQAANFDALIATHSPFIVGDKTELLVPLNVLPE